MKLTAIKKLCVAHKTFVIINAWDGRQWLSDNRNCYPVDGVHIHPDSIPALFDLTPKQAGGLQINEIMMLDDERLSVEPMDSEKPLESMGAVWYAGALFRVLGSADGLIFVPVDTLKPADNKTGLLKFSERVSPTGDIMVACYSDMLVGALVHPVTQKTAESIMAVVQMISLQAIRTNGAPDAEAEAERAEREAEETIRRNQQHMDLGKDTDPEDEPEGEKT